MRTATGTTKRPSALLAASAILALAISGCAENSASQSGGDGIEPGATKGEYQEAFEDYDAITLSTQVPAPKGSPTSADMVAYLEAVTEWSGGKIEFDIAYSNAVAEPGEQDDALNDGRLDIAPVLPIYDPAEYPVTNFFIDAGVLSDPSAVAGVIQSNLWPNEVALSSDEFREEWESKGLIPLVPFFNSGPTSLFCSSPRQSLDQLDGTTMSVGGSVQLRQVKSLGASPTSVPYSELYESLNRGVVDCAVTPPGVAVLSGVIPSAAQVTADPNVTFAAAPGGFAFSKMRWEELPLLAQQLFWDRLDVFVGENVTTDIWPGLADMATQVRENDGEIMHFAADAQAKLQATNEAVIDDLRKSDAVTDPSGLIDEMSTSSAEWTAAVVDELGTPEGVDLAGFEDWFTNSDLDVEAFHRLITEQIFAPHRPS